MSAAEVITDNIDLWTSAITHKSTAGRGRNGKIELTGIKKLRELILELAVRGKLVPQNPDDESASTLLEKIADEKERLVKEGKIKKPKPLPEISEDEKPFELPEGWEWCRLGYVFNSIASGGTPSKNNPAFWNGDIPWASVKDLNGGKYISVTQDTITEEGLKSGSKLAVSGDVLLCTRMGLGKIVICQTSIAFNQDLKAIKLSEQVDIDYYYLSYATLELIGTGTTVAGITQEKLLNLPYALPPLPEQHRIVAKVDELMALCDRLEERTGDQLEAHETLVDVLLNTLTDAADAQELGESWARVQEHFDTLFTTEQSIDRLQQIILQLAVMGRLVPQNPDDEPASILLEKIAAEKDRLVKEGKIKKPKPLPEITEDEKPFELPEGWVWCRLAEIAYQVTDGTHHTPQYSKDGVPFLSVKDISSGKLCFDNTRFISQEQHDVLIKRCRPEKGDMLLTKVGTTGVPVLIVTDIEFSIFVSVALIKFDKKNYLGTFFRHLLAAPLLREQAEEGTEGIGNKNLVLRKISTMVLVIPPLPEQHRIVERVDELMALCDQLKQRLRDAGQTQLHLAEAVVEGATA
ncbi:restriction endonuclease subunit S [Spirochaeta dissipatitropha]